MDEELLRYRFVNTSGVIVLDVIDSGPEKIRCRNFADQISDAIRKARNLQHVE